MPVYFQKCWIFPRWICLIVCYLEWHRLTEPTSDSYVSLNSWCVTN